jgi:hypothetical protein
MPKWTNAESDGECLIPNDEAAPSHVAGVYTAPARGNSRSKSGPIPGPYGIKDPPSNLMTFQPMQRMSVMCGMFGIPRFGNSMLGIWG